MPLKCHIKKLLKLWTSKVHVVKVQWAAASLPIISLEPLRDFVIQIVVLVTTVSLNQSDIIVLSANQPDRCTSSRFLVLSAVNSLSQQPSLIKPTWAILISRRPGKLKSFCRSVALAVKPRKVMSSDKAKPHSTNRSSSLVGNDLTADRLYQHDVVAGHVRSITSAMKQSEE
jgi:hypothetical protein